MRSSRLKIGRTIAQRIAAVSDMSGPMDAGMDITINEKWCRKTQGFTLKTQNVKSLGRDKTSLCIGSGLPFDPAEAARVAAAERQAEGGLRRDGDPIGWLSLIARTNQGPVNRKPQPRPSRPPPLAGPIPEMWEARSANVQSGVASGKDITTDEVRKGFKGKSASGFSHDADYADKDPVDTRPIVNVRINGGIMSPSRWDQKTSGFIGTDRMRYTER